MCHCFYKTAFGFLVGMTICVAIDKHYHTTQSVVTTNSVNFIAINNNNNNNNGNNINYKTAIFFCATKIIYSCSSEYCCTDFIFTQ
jgi:hypothetical protein